MQINVTNNVPVSAELDQIFKLRMTNVIVQQLVVIIRFSYEHIEHLMLDELNFLLWTKL